MRVMRVNYCYILKVIVLAFVVTTAATSRVSALNKPDTALREGLTVAHLGADTNPHGAVLVTTDGSDLETGLRLLEEFLETNMPAGSKKAKVDLLTPAGKKIRVGWRPDQAMRDKGNDDILIVTGFQTNDAQVSIINNFVGVYAVAKTLVLLNRSWVLRGEGEGVITGSFVAGQRDLDACAA